MYIQVALGQDEYMDTKIDDNGDRLILGLVALQVGSRCSTSWFSVKTFSKKNNMSFWVREGPVSYKYTKYGFSIYRIIIQIKGIF
jgi:hypothetical protein